MFQVRSISSAVREHQGSGVYGTRTPSDATYNPIMGTHAWALNSLGPAHRVNSCLNIEYSARGIAGYTPTDALYAVAYDPNNGTAGPGGIPRTGGDTRYTNR